MNVTRDLLTVWIAGSILTLTIVAGAVVVAALRSAARLPAPPRPPGRRATEQARKTPHTPARVPAPRPPTTLAAAEHRAELDTVLGCTRSTCPHQGHT